jgi:hypothetical protein
MRDEADPLRVHQHTIVGRIADAVHRFTFWGVNPRVSYVHEFDVRTQNRALGGDDRKVFPWAPVNLRILISTFHGRNRVLYCDLGRGSVNKIATWAAEGQ